MSKETEKRVHSLDFLRGICLLLMTFNHLMSSGFRGIYTDIMKFSYQTFGFISAADGFVFISGLVVGMTLVQKKTK